MSQSVGYKMGCYLGGFRTCAPDNTFCTVSVWPASVYPRSTVSLQVHKQNPSHALTENEDSRSDETSSSWFESASYLSGPCAMTAIASRTWRHDSHIRPGIKIDVHKSTVPIQAWQCRDNYEDDGKVMCWGLLHKVKTTLANRILHKAPSPYHW